MAQWAQHQHQHHQQDHYLSNGQPPRPPRAAVRIQPPRHVPFASTMRPGPVVRVEFAADDRRARRVGEVFATATLYYCAAESDEDEAVFVGHGGYYNDDPAASAAAYGLAVQRRLPAAAVRVYAGAFWGTQRRVVLHQASSSPSSSRSAAARSGLGNSGSSAAGDSMFDFDFGDSDMVMDDASIDGVGDGEGDGDSVYIWFEFDRVHIDVPGRFFLHVAVHFLDIDAGAEAADEVVAEVETQTFVVLPPA